jgi:hypothetical protein
LVILIAPFRQTEIDLVGENHTSGSRGQCAPNTLLCFFTGSFMNSDTGSSLIVNRAFAASAVEVAHLVDVRAHDATPGPAA